MTFLVLALFFAGAQSIVMDRLRAEFSLNR